MTLLDEDGRPYQVPHYNVSELILEPALDEELDRSTFEGQEWMRAQQGEMSTGITMHRYPDSLSGP